MAIMYMLPENDPGILADDSTFKDKLISANKGFLNALLEAYPEQAKPFKKRLDVYLEGYKPHRFPSLKNPYFNTKLIPTPTYTAKAIVSQVADKYGLTFEDIIGRKRTWNLLPARLVALDEVNLKFPQWSTPQLGRLFNRDHSTIVYTLQKIRILKEKELWPPVIKSLKASQRIEFMKSHAEDIYAVDESE